MPNHDIATVSPLPSFQARGGGAGRLDVALVVALVSWPALVLAQAGTHSDSADWSSFIAAPAEPGRDGRPVDHLFQRTTAGGPWVPMPAGSLASPEREWLSLLAQGQWTQAQTWLKDADPALDAQDAEGRTALTLAVQGNQPALLRELIRRGAPLDQKGVGGHTPLGLAAYLGQDVMVAELLRQGADPLTHSSLGQTALHLAAATGHTRCVAALLQARPAARWLDVYNRAGRHALAEAAFAGQLPVIRQLAQAGWPLSQLDAHQLNAVHAAALGEQWAVADHLIAQGVPVPGPITQVLLDRRTP